MIRRKVLLIVGITAVFTLGAIASLQAYWYHHQPISCVCNYDVNNCHNNCIHDVCYGNQCKVKNFYTTNERRCICNLR